MNKTMILSIGEVVWDIFNNRKILGGAPLNVAYHLCTLGHSVRLISRIGSDALGDETIRRVTELDLDSHHIQRDPHQPTGQVMVTVNEAGEPLFDIVAPAAWDEIDATLLRTAIPDEPFHLIFGSLAQRSPVSRAAIRLLREKASLRFYDVNLRPPFTGKDIVSSCLAESDVVKINEAELDQVGDWLNLPAGPPRQRSLDLFKLLNPVALAVTLGAHGAMLVTRDGLFFHPGFPVQVADTVGAGDAFFSTLIHGILEKYPWPVCLEQANKRAAFVAERHGATPSMADFPSSSSEI
ncbi:MAG: carbohydrate kinase family protein [Thermodesulfobacteriota bacterium]